MIDIDQMQKFITDACVHYAKSAPLVSEYLDDLYIRCDEDRAAVTLDELFTVGMLYEEGAWHDQNHAQNLIYKLMERRHAAGGMLSF